LGIGEYGGVGRCCVSGQGIHHGGTEDAEAWGMRKSSFVILTFVLLS